jgi:hypothetical protein
MASNCLRPDLWELGGMVVAECSSMSIDVLEDSRSNVVVLGPDLQRSEPLQPCGTLRHWPLLVDQPAPGDFQTTCARGPGKGFRTCRLRPRVTLIMQDEMARLLDMRGGKSFVLDPIGTRMLIVAMERGSEAMLQAVAGEYEVAETQVREDWRNLLGDLKNAGLTEAVWLGPTNREPPNGLAVWLRLALARLSFWLLGWERTVRAWRCRDCSRLRPDSREGERLITTVDDLVRGLAGSHLLNPQCKERALTSWTLLRQMGLPARLVMGVALYPFEAHAWTECGDRIVGDDRARCAQFAPVSVYE